MKKVKERRERTELLLLSLFFSLSLPLFSLFNSKTSTKKMGGAAVIINSEAEWTAALEKATAEGKAVRFSFLIDGARELRSMFFFLLSLLCPNLADRPSLPCALLPMWHRDRP